MSVPFQGIIMARQTTGAIAAVLLLASAQPALAHGHRDAPAAPGTWQGSWQGGEWQGGSWQGGAAYPAGAYPAGAYPVQPDPRWRELEERCRNYGKRDNGVGGAVIGGVVGGVIGNRVAPGDRVLGTVAGAAVGAVAGAAIDKAEDRKRERTRDRECEEFQAHSGAGYGAYPAPAPGYAYGYVPMGYVPMGYVMVPVQPVQAAQQPCTETKTVTYEYVTVRSRKAWQRPAPVRHDKRVKEKRVYTGS